MNLRNKRITPQAMVKTNNPHDHPSSVLFIRKEANFIKEKDTTKIEDDRVMMVLLKSNKCVSADSQS